MAPVCVASRLRLTRLFVIVLLLFMINQHAFTAFIYDRQILFDIRNSIKELIKQDLRQAFVFLRMGLLYRKVCSGCPVPFLEENGAAAMGSEAVYPLDGNCTWRPL